MCVLQMVAPSDGTDDIFFMLRSPKEEKTVAEPTMAETTLMTNVEGLHESPAKVMYERNTEQCHPTDHVKTRSGRIVKKPKRFDDYEL